MEMTRRLQKVGVAARGLSISQGLILVHFEMLRYKVAWNCAIGSVSTIIVLGLCGIYGWSLAVSIFGLAATPFVT